MATLLELRSLFSDADLLKRVESATVIAANDLLSGTPTAAQKAWASLVFSSPVPEAKKALMATLAGSSSFTVSQIQGATDSAIQAAVDGVAQILADALAGV